MDKIMKDRADYIPVISRASSARLRLSDITVIERMSRKIKFSSDKGEYQMYGKISDVREQLDGRFFFCLDGLAVNLDRIESVDNQEVFLDNGEVLRLSRDSFRRLRRAYEKHIGGQGNGK